MKDNLLPFPSLRKMTPDPLRGARRVRRALVRVGLSLLVLALVIALVALVNGLFA